MSMEHKLYDCIEDYKIDKPENVVTVYRPRIFSNYLQRMILLDIYFYSKADAFSYGRAWVEEDDKQIKKLRKLFQNF